MLLESGMNEVNSRRRHQRQGSLLASIVPKPTQGFQVSIPSSRSSFKVRIVLLANEVFAPEKDLRAHILA